MSQFLGSLVEKCTLVGREDGGKYQRKKKQMELLRPIE